MAVDETNILRQRFRLPDGRSFTARVEHLDDYHFDMGGLGNVFHICQFAEVMEDVYKRQLYTFAYIPLIFCLITYKIYLSRLLLLSVTTTLSALHLYG